MTPHRAGALLAAAVLACGCQGYTYTLNDRTVFTPPPLYAGYEIADRALADCVQQAIEDQHITAPTQLEDLNCSAAGIESLAGLGVFTGLKRLGLDGNRLTGVAGIENLRKLELLQLRDNRLAGQDPAMCGTGRSVALSGNEGFRCEDLEVLRACGVTLADVPAACAGR